MIEFENQNFSTSLFNESSVFICAFGYETRSIALYEKIKNVVNSENILALIFSDYKRYAYISSGIDRLLHEDNIKYESASYEKAETVWNNIIDFIQAKIVETQFCVDVHIDYSSMPRKWYYCLPFRLTEIFGKKIKIHFWYMSGIYPGDYEAYPSAGIESFSVIGKPSLRIGTKRTHIVGLSYDAVRTSAMISILDPESFVTCNAYNKKNEEINRNVRIVNEQIISMASMEISLQIDDFSFMISKLSELTNEFLPIGDVILVPDGPKPLIFAMSIIPQLFNKAGITCLHVARNKDFFKAINVEANNVVYGFSVKQSSD